MLTAKDLKLVYPDGEKENVVLDNVNMTIEAGETVVLLGPSGSGKSSLIYLLSCLKKPTSGEVLLNGNSLSALKDTSNERYDSFGFIFQQHFLIPYLTVLENVSLAKRDTDIKEKSAELLKKLGLGASLNKKPHQLSGGERQRVAVARALVKEPSIIFADEPTASLDHATGKDVMDLLRGMKENTTLILATHDTFLLNGDERVFWVCDKKIEERKQ